MATPRQWVEGARPRTLPAAVSPVVAGTGAASAIHGRSLGIALLALLVGVFLQIGVNYANDYSDGIRGTDADRVGPVRLVGQHLADPGNVRIVAFGSFGCAALAGLAMVALSGAWLLLPVGLLAILAAWRYTGGENPYGYRGLGELYVFVFFGLVATLGTLYAQSGRVTWVGLLAAVGVGALTTAILVANNLRDIPSDAATGKLTLAVRLGDRRARALYAGLLLVALAVVGGLVPLASPWVLLALASFALVVRPLAALLRGATGRDLVPVLVATGQLDLAYAVLLALGLILGA